MTVFRQVLNYIKEHPGTGYLEIAQGCDLRLKVVHMVCTILERQGRIKGREVGKMEWVKRGRTMRDKRVHGKPYVTIFEAAEARGLSASEYSKMEQGITEPD